MYGKEQVYNWRRSYHVQPPNGESLEMCLGRAVAFFKDHVRNMPIVLIFRRAVGGIYMLRRILFLQIEPQLLRGRHVMVVAHANSLRSIIMYLDKLSSEEVRVHILPSTHIMLSFTLLLIYYILSKGYKFRALNRCAYALHI